MAIIHKIVIIGLLKHTIVTIKCQTQALTFFKNQVGNL